MNLNSRHNLYAPIHKGLRACMSHLLVRVGRLDAHDPDEVAEVRAEMSMLLTVCRHHVEHEDRFIHPILQQRAPGVSDAVSHDHPHHLASLDALQARLDAIGGSPEAVAVLYREFGAFVADNFEHMQREETVHNEALWAVCSDDELLAIHGRIVSSLTPLEHEFGARWMVPHLTPSERAEMMTAMRADAAPAAFEGLLNLVRPLLGGRDWAKLARALELPARPWTADVGAA